MKTRLDLLREELDYVLERQGLRGKLGSYNVQKLLHAWCTTALDYVSDLNQVAS